MTSEAFVVVPSYNHAPYIEKCLRSIIGQTVHPAKLLIIDDGSRDGSPQIIESVLKDCPFPSELIARENHGLCRTLNQALSLSSGKYFAYIGSDDLWLPEFLSERVNLMELRAKAVLAYGHAYLINDQDQIYDRTSDYSDSWGDFPDGDAKDMLLDGFAPISSTVLYRRSVIENIGWNDTAKLEDYEMYLRLAKIGDFAFDPQILSAWRNHGYNTSKNLLMMHDEVMQAQRRHITGFGISEPELIAVQMRTKFRYAQMLLQEGEKAAGISLLVQGWRAARSLREVAKLLIQIILPKALLLKYRDAKRAKNITANPH